MRASASSPKLRAKPHSAVIALQVASETITTVRRTPRSAQRASGMPASV